MSSIVGSVEMGRRVRSLRAERRLTLKQVEEASGLSATHLSDIERGRTSPTIGVLTRIARALKRDVAYFVEPEERSDVAHLPCERLAGYTTACGTRVDQLTPGVPGSSLFAYRLSLGAPPTHPFTLASREPPGEVLYFVRQGRVKISFGEMHLVLGPGDATQGLLGHDHKMHALGNGPAQVIALLTQGIERRRTHMPRSEPPSPPPSPALPEPPGAVGPGLYPRDPSPAELGHRIRMLRLTRGLTLKDLELRGGISATHISEIERGRASPTVGALGRIAHALGLRPATLVEPQVLPEVSLMRAAARAVHYVRLGTAKVAPVTGPMQEALLGAQLLVLPAGSEPAFSHRHEGEEWATVLAGTAKVLVNGKPRRLREGDSIHFRAHMEHSYTGLSPAPTTLLVANRPRPTL